MDVNCQHVSLYDGSRIVPFILWNGRSKTVSSDGLAPVDYGSPGRNAGMILIADDIDSV